jgi:hypothetical protein
VEGGAVEEGGCEFFFTGKVSLFLFGSIGGALEGRKWRGRYPRVMRAEASEGVMKLCM